jgi:uncharacterized HhH-GPD family protein
MTSNAPRSQASYPFTSDPAANALLAESGTALLIGLCLEQQVRSEKAMIGPLHLRERIGHIDAKRIAAMRPATLDAAFRRTPALHRFPGMMAKRVRALCAIIAQEYGDDGARVWKGIGDAKELYERFRALPGFGDGKAACAVRILGKFGKKKIAGWQRYAMDDDLPWEFKAGKKITL